ncbi:MAG: hypothetical protein ACNI3A_01510 [Desulfovibrio sp.]|uniref:hypothetical protein n=1 Tax=Desulfovibrio sp. 7SRBS1 TaxID=3378064 RepID=UPI003B415A55
MGIDGVVNSFTAGADRAHTESHPPVIRIGKLKTGNGVLPTGQLLVRDANNLLVPYTGAENEVMVGVLDIGIDTAVHEIGEYVIHGTVKARLLSKDNGSELTTEDIFALYKIGIFAE